MDSDDSIEDLRPNRTTPELKDRPRLKHPVIKGKQNVPSNTYGVTPNSFLTTSQDKGKQNVPSNTYGVTPNSFLISSQDKSGEQQQFPGNSRAGVHVPCSQHPLHSRNQDTFKKNVIAKPLQVASTSSAAVVDLFQELESCFASGHSFDDSVLFQCRARPNLPERVKHEWRYGKVSAQPLETALYVTPIIKLPKEYIPKKDVYVRKESIPGLGNLINLVEGDKVEFLLSTRQLPHEKTPAGIKPSAYKASILSYCGSRTFKQLQSYFINAKEVVVESSTRTEAMNSIMGSDALWFYLFNVECKSDNSAAYPQFVKMVLAFVFLLADHMDSFPSRRKEIFAFILEKNFLENLKSSSDKELMELRFAKLAVTLDPTFLKKVIPLLNKIVKSNSSAVASVLYDMLLKVGNVADLSNWHSLTQIPTIEELFGDPLEKVKYLKPVLLTCGYQNADDYLNVYYRLLRTECFSAIQKGISDLRQGQLDARDMTVYEKVTVQDIDIEHTTILISLKFSLQKPVSNWKKSKKLMFGNLLCISVKGDFSDAIWLTVADRDNDILQKHNVIGVELISFHNSNVDSAESIRTMILHSGKMIMAESPTYFQSFQHVLTSLRHSEIGKFHLADAIVHGKHSNGVDYHEVISPYYNKVDYFQLEENQQKAFVHALQSPLGIIQGPPGTGKTYVGAKLAQILLYMQEEKQLNNILQKHGVQSVDKDVANVEGNPSTEDENPPILVLTYKNHALDEFLKHCTEFCDKKYITRIGSQSKEDELKDCLLHIKMKTTTIRRIATRGLITEIEDLFKGFSTLLLRLDELKVFTMTSFIRRLSNEQLFTFINRAIQLQAPSKSSSKKLPQIPDLLNYFGKWADGSQFRVELLDNLTIPVTKQNPNDHDENMRRTITLKLKNAFMSHWLPNKHNLKALTDLQQRGAAFFNTYLIDMEDEIVDEDYLDNIDGDDADELDEDYINEQFSLRTSAFDEDHIGRYRSRVVKTKQMAKLDALKSNTSKNTSKKANNNQSFCMSDFPSSCAINKGILSKIDLWDMSDIDKYTYIYSFLHAGYDGIIEEMNSALEKINILQKQKQMIDESNKLQVLKTQKIVGATIIGASVQLSLIQKMAPKVVMVEEAAEILESCLVAVLSKSVQKLILIGDHKQLKPQVDTYHLRKEHSFHISMMERLIRVGFPYEKLVRQGRMRPEFSCMLKDIYPKYEDFSGLSIKNTPIVCLSQTMFFWSHSYEENKDRSVKNLGEANMVISLVLFFIASGVNEKDITILCAYLGQVQLVRKLYRENMNLVTAKTDALRKLVDIRTIDEYQGDENKFVIVSLTRSNKSGVIGFLKEVERRCVAQSRAKCGLYFVGNAAMFKKSKTWKPITNKMEQDFLINEKLPIRCFRHPDIVYEVIQSEDIQKKGITDKNQLMYYVQTNNKWCKVVCNVLFDCEIEAHRCKKLCTPRHDDSKCLTKDSYTFKVCGHNTMKECYVDEKDMKCKFSVDKTLPCGHEKTVLCHVWQFDRTNIMCTETCSKSYSCPSKHDCELVCSRSHSHNAENCPVQIEFEIPACKHKAHFKKVCGKPIPQVKCKFQRRYKSDKCGHEQKRSCSEEEVCHHPCQRQRPDCGHPCVKECWEPCLGGKDCEICETEYINILDAARKAAELQLESCRSEAASLDHFSLLPISSDLDEFLSVTEKCKVFFSLYANSSITEMVNVWKVQCPSITIQFWDRATKAHGPLREELFKCSHGFLDMSSILDKTDIFGCLILSNSFEFTKYASGRLTSMPGNEYTIIISDVLLGDCLDKRELDRKDAKKPMVGYLKQREKDSIIEIRPNGPAAYSVYESCNILPTYIVHLKCGKVVRAPIMQGVLDKFEDGEYKFILSELNLRDVSDPIVEIVQKAISLYRGDCSKRDSYTQSRQPLKEIKAVGIVINREIDQKYEEKKTRCNEKKVKVEVVFGYHATKPENVASIIKTNLDPSRAGTAFGTAYGVGCYFSEHPEFSFLYGQKCMFIFKVMLIEGQYTKVQPDGRGFCQQLVLADASMFKPQYVLHF